MEVVSSRIFIPLEIEYWQYDPKKQNKRLCEEVPSATHPLDPGEQNPTGSPEFVAVSPQYASQQKEKMSL